MNPFFKENTHATDANTNASDITYQDWRRNFLHKRLHLGIIISTCAFFSFFLLGTQVVGTDDYLQVYWMVIILHQCPALMLCLLLLYLPFGKRHPEVVFILFSAIMTLPFALEEVGNGKLEPAFIPWTLAFLSQATLAPVYWQLHVLSQVMLVAMLSLLYWGLDLQIIEIQTGGYGIFPNSVMLLYLIWFCVICDIGIYLYEKLQRSEFKTRLKLATEHQALKDEKVKSERLLCNILPVPIAERLKQQQTDIIADAHTEVSIVFADIVRFTELSHRTSANELVTLLNQVFCRFDQLAEQHQLEKIKTIGDAYMAVSGLPNANASHAQNAVNFALAMQHALADCNAKQGVDLDIRVGIHTGSVVAGVIGLTKFSYDLWGDNVNIASRMESHGLPGKIHISAAVYEQLKHSSEYLFTAREVIMVKGKGEMSTYWVDSAASSRV